MTTTTGRRLRQSIAFTVPALLVAVLIAGCAGGGSSDDAGSTSDPGVAAGLAPDPGTDAQDGTQFSAEEDTGTDQDTQAATETIQDTTDLTKAKVVSTGTVSLSSKDPDQAMRTVYQIVDEHGGQVGDERAETSPDGDVEWARLVVRVPVDEFDDALADLKQVGRLGNSTRKSAVVTAEYVDLQSRVRAHERSLKRVELLYSRAQSIRDIMSIESEVATRQAALDSLKGQLRVLDDQTTLSTITVHVSQLRGAKPTTTKKAGFVAGLRFGWEQVKTLFVGIATGVGAALPFLMVAIPIGLVLWLAIRRLAARRSRKAEARA